MGLADGDLVKTMESVPEVPNELVDLLNPR
jgi:hypothetical protein